MKVIWLDRDGYTEKTETMTPRQATVKVLPLLKPGGDLEDPRFLRRVQYCAAVNMEAGTLTIYRRGGSWCSEHKGQCLGNGCSSS